MIKIKYMPRSWHTPFGAVELVVYLQSFVVAADAVDYK